jgi:hypothetical protein
MNFRSQRQIRIIALADSKIGPRKIVPNPGSFSGKTASSRAGNRSWPGSYKAFRKHLDQQGVQKVPYKRINPSSYPLAMKG